jgi:hypothetical protein
MLTIKAGFVVPMAVATVLAMSGCGDTNLDSTKQTVKTSTKASFSGRVVDVNGDSMSGVSVTVFANQKYTTSTDSKGNYQIEVNMGDVVASGGGGSGNTDNSNIGDTQNTLYREFPIEVSKSGYATYRQVIEFQGNIGYTDGSGAVVLLSQVGSALPKTVLYPYVDSFQFTVYAGDSPAAGAVVTLDGSGNESSSTWNTSFDDSSYFKTGYKTFVADSNGQVTITADDKLPANGCYGAFVAPYDTNSDAQYEYNATNTSSCFFDLSAARQDSSSMIHDDGTGTLVQTENAPTINLVDYSSDTSIVYNSLQGHDTIPVAQASDFSITIMFNRPVTDEMLAGWGGPLFSLKANDGNMPVPITVTNVGNYLYTITPDITLDPSRNEYYFRVNSAISYPASWTTPSSTTYAGYSEYFVIYDPTATLNAAIVPGLHIDDNSTYKVDWDRFLVGDATTANPLSEDTTQGGSHGDDLRITFPADANATGYQFWVKDGSSPWINVDDDPYGYVNITKNDGQVIEATLNQVFYPYFAGGEFVNQSLDSAYWEPLLNGNTMQVVVMPENINGFATDPNTDSTIAGLTLADNWGPGIVQSGSYNFLGTYYTSFNTGTYCDAENVNIAFGEPLDGSVTLTPEFGTDEYGAKAVTNSPCFTVKAVRFTDNSLVDPSTDPTYQSDFSFIQMDLEPAVATTTTADAMAGDNVISVADNTGFAMGDNVRIGDTNEYLYGLVGTTGLLVNSLGADEVSGSDAHWRGPVQNGYSDVTGTLSANSGQYSQYLDVASNADVVAGSARLSTGELVTAKGQYFGFGMDQIFLNAAPTAVIAPGAAVTGYNVNVSGTCNTTLAAAAAAGANTITVASGTDCADGDPIVIDFGDAAGGIELFTISSGGGTTTLTLSGNLANAHAVGETVDERSTWSTTSTTGWPRVAVGSTTGIKVGSTITFDNGTDTDTATVVSVINGYVFLDAIPTASTSFDFITGDSWTVDSSRAPDALEVQVMDTSGNTTDDTDRDGDGIADRDQIGYEEVGGSWDRF